MKISKTGIGPFYKDFKDPDWTPEIRKELKQNPDWIISVQLSDDPSKVVDHEFTVKELSTGKYKSGLYRQILFKYNLGNGTIRCKIGDSNFISNVPNLIQPTV